MAKKFLENWIIKLLAAFVFITNLRYSFAQEYTLQPGDRVAIAVLGQPEFTRLVVVPPNKEISYPLVGEIKVGGMSTQELADKITERLTGFIPHPQVTVELEKYKIEKVYILGALSRPGEYPIKEGARGIKLIELLARAGGPTKVASLKKAKDN